MSHNMCFKFEECGSMKAKPRERRFSTSPQVWRGKINLCESHWLAGFRRKEKKS